MGIHLSSSCVACWKVHWRQHILDQLLPVLTLFTFQCQCLLLCLHWHPLPQAQNWEIIFVFVLVSVFVLVFSLLAVFVFCLSFMFLAVLDELLNNGNGYRSSPRRSVQCGALLHIHDSPLHHHLHHPSHHHHHRHHCLKIAIFAKFLQPFSSARSSFSHSDILAIHPQNHFFQITSVLNKGQ